MDAAAPTAEWLRRQRWFGAKASEPTVGAACSTPRSATTS